MADLLGDVDTNIPAPLPLKPVKIAARRKVRVLSPPVSGQKKTPLPKRTQAVDAIPSLSTPPLEPNYTDENSFLGGMDDDEFPPSDPLPSSPTLNAVDRKSQPAVKMEEDDEDMMEIAQVTGDHKVKLASVNMSGSRPVPKIAKAPAYPSPESSSPTRPPTDEVDASSWNNVTSKLNVLSSQGPENASFGKLRLDNAVEDDGSILFFWTDYTEINGSLCLFGKVKDNDSDTYVSAFVKVDNIMRKLYFLPRTYHQSE